MGLVVAVPGILLARILDKRSGQAAANDAGID